MIMTFDTNQVQIYIVTIIDDHDLHPLFFGYQIYLIYKLRWLPRKFNVDFYGNQW